MGIKELKEFLLKENHTIVIYKSDASLVVSNERGIAPLIKLLSENRTQLKDSIIADKVIGKAAALLMVYGEAKEVFTPTISYPALKVLKSHNIKIHYDNIVERIINRKGDGLCPMETLCIDVDEPEKAFILMMQHHITNS